MRRVLLSCLFVVFAFVPGGQALAAGSDEIDWSVTDPESGVRVGSEVEATGPGTFPLVTLEDPSIDRDHYEVRGERCGTPESKVPPTWRCGASLPTGAHTSPAPWRTRVLSHQ